MAENSSIEVRYCGGELDEVVAQSPDLFVHLEQMNHDEWVLIIDTPGDQHCSDAGHHSWSVRVSL